MFEIAELFVGDLVRAETFADLLSQADYLLSEGYHLAAGVLGRAVMHAPRQEETRLYIEIIGTAMRRIRPSPDPRVVFSVTQTRHFVYIAVDRLFSSPLPLAGQ